MTHLTWEDLNDYADGSMAQNARAAASNHLDSCADCRDTVARIGSLLDAAKSVPQSLEPPAEAWAGIRTTIEGQKVVQLPQSGSRRVPARVPMLIAAAVMLIVASSVTTMKVMQRNDYVVTVPPAVVIAPRTDSMVLPVSVVQMERGYLKTVDELSTALEKSRAQLAPETVRAVEHSLKVIDDAIAEARTALLHDPANPLLQSFLTKYYEQKVDFLRRVSGRTT